MIMKTTKEMIDVMQAQLDGEQIEESIDKKVWFTCEPIWNWAKCDYRVKPKKKYIPFDTAEEFLAAQREHGCDVISIDDGGALKAHDISVSLDGSVYDHMDDGDVDYIGKFEDLLFEDYKFADGTPCGKEVIS